MNRLNQLMLGFAFLFSFQVLGQEGATPKLVVGIVVDQMRYDYLLRFSDDMSDSGFNRLIKQGYLFKQAHYSYIPTYTGPGHATIYSGADPSIHGICGNAWYDSDQAEIVNCVQDDQITKEGIDLVQGRSPVNLNTTNIADQLKMVNGDNSKVISIGMKDRGAILPGGHNPDGAYWFNDKDGHWVTSAFYTESVPDWVVQFNKKELSAKYLNEDWTLSKNLSQSKGVVDFRKYEGKLGNAPDPVFPYPLKEVRKSSKFDLMKYTPFGNQYTFDFALEAFEKEKLGEHEKSDLLMISISSTDYIGHLFGPYSLEVYDTYIKLDAQLARFISAIEGELGKENVVFFLTSDHGVMEIPEYLKEKNILAGRFSTRDLEQNLNNHLKELTNLDGLVADIINYNIYFNHEILNEHPEKTSEIYRLSLEYLGSQEFVSKAVVGKGLSQGDFRHPMLKMASKGYVPGRSGEIVFIVAPGWIESGYESGTTHGSGYSYDTHVPLIFYGGNIKSGESSKEVDIKDIAITISDILEIEQPSGSDGKMLQVRPRIKEK